MYRLKLKHPISLFLICVSLTACTAVEQGHVKPPLVYRIDIQQGNEINQSMLNKLRVGMDERQVKFIMGTPLLVDPFHPERWEYVYYKQESGEEPVSRHITLYFKDKHLSHISGDVKVTFVPVTNEEVNTERSVNVPESYGYRGLLDRWFDDRPELIRKRKEEAEEALGSNDGSTKQFESEKTVEATDEESDSDIINTVDDELDIEETKSEASINSEEPVDPAYSLDNTENAPKEKPGFFSRMWDKMTGDEPGDEPDYEFLDPESKTEQ